MCICQELCQQASTRLDSKVVHVENAVTDLTALLLSWGEGEALVEEEEDMQRKPPSTATSMARQEVHFYPGEASALRRRQLWREMQQEANYLREFFCHQNLDALVKLTRTTLENLRKRINASSALGYTELSEEQKKEHQPVFEASATLAIPSLLMKPSLEEIQTAVNNIVQIVLCTYKRVYLWGQNRSLLKPDRNQSNILAARSSKGNITQVEEATPPGKQLKNFHRLVSENKEVAKLVSFLSTTVTSSKRLVTEALEQFNKYQELWTVDRDVRLKEFMETKPLISEFEAEMRKYEDQEVLIMDEPNSVVAGPIALKTGTYKYVSKNCAFQVAGSYITLFPCSGPPDNLKISLCAETKGWKVALGRRMNEMYRQVMQDTLDQIEDLSKRLSRPIEDLDDIRVTMAAQKELRENEITIDLSLGPIEVSPEL